MGMRNTRMWVSLVGLSVFGVLLLNYFPSQLIGDGNFQGAIAAYAFYGVIFYVLVYLMGSSSLQYFRLPRWHVKSLIAFGWVMPMMWVNVTSPDNVSKPLAYAIPGVVFLFFVGFGEEVLSRGLVFGVLSRFGLYRAIFISSLMFGLMHLNLYIGAGWDPWQAYAHVISTTSFGVLSCGLMILTRSIWSSVILHLFFNWNLVFDKDSGKSLSSPDWQFASLWDGLTYPLLGGLTAIAGGILFLIIDRLGFPQILNRFAIKWKLVTPKL